MANLEWAQDLASELIDEYGTDITIKLWMPVTDPSNPWVEQPPAEVSYPDLRGLFTNFKIEQIDGTLIQEQDRLVLVAGQDLEVVDFQKRLRGTVTLDATGQAWQIRGINVVAPDEFDVLYKIHVRL